MSHWHALGEIWQAAFEQAVFAYLRQASAPIGAVVVDDHGVIVARGANNISGNRLAHAEYAALSQFPPGADFRKHEIYSTLEPCPMCTGAIRMCQLPAVHFAAFDPSAGSAELLNANEFMREFPCSIHPPTHPQLELAIVALVVEYRIRTGHHRWRSHWLRYHLHGAELGAHLASSNAYREWVDSSISAGQLYEHLTLLRQAA